jgi:hypothetical protein
MVTPSLKVSPESTVRTWADVYKRGAAAMPKVALGVSLAYGYAAYDVHARGGAWTGLIAAAGSVLAIVPFTLLVMSRTNSMLHKAVEQGTAGNDPKVNALLDTWSLMNYGRSLFPLAGAVIGFLTLSHYM